MSEDLLKAATRALREETSEAAADGEFTRARVMASLHQGKVRRRTRLAFLLPIAACLAAGTAWGTATGRLPAAFRALREVVYPTAKPPERQQPRPAPPTPTPTNAVPAVQTSDASPPPLPSSEEPVARPPVASARPAPSTSSSAAFQDADGDLYRLAHDAHFKSHDYARALGAWEAYLRAAPGGRLATEARYNRAICLLRLGRDAEARQALEPFAAGKLGYRQSEAQQLLDELSSQQ
jgi:TolA-binding protein